MVVSLSSPSSPSAATAAAATTPPSMSSQSHSALSPLPPGPPVCTESQLSSQKTSAVATTVVSSMDTLTSLHATAAATYYPMEQNMQHPSLTSSPVHPLQPKSGLVEPPLAGLAIVSPIPHAGEQTIPEKYQQQQQQQSQDDQYQQQLQQQQQQQQAQYQVQNYYGLGQEALPR
ncbi:hypothetical protein BGZ95_002834 [Linnemannia exigua]|uniref:Uncharacterized protein n=1 Tax=Linnemannia exigua TaxID=604196 RepID=A0AAD4D5E2_9FUNG|nr:hypothetical protein BGZ95_002834 [Linnemannia exigua]